VRIHFHGILNEDSDSPRAGTHAASDFGYTFQIGSENSIAGLNRGLDGLCKGGKVVIVVPPEMAFGDKGYGRKIPPNATIDFDIGAYTLFRVVLLLVVGPRETIFHFFHVIYIRAFIIFYHFLMQRFWTCHAMSFLR